MFSEKKCIYYTSYGKFVWVLLFHWGLRVYYCTVYYNMLVYYLREYLNNSQWIHKFKSVYTVLPLRNLCGYYCSIGEFYTIVLYITCLCIIWGSISTTPHGYINLKVCILYFLWEIWVGTLVQLVNSCILLYSI